MGTITKTVKRLETKRGNAQRPDLEKPVRKVIEDVREALHVGNPAAVDAIDQLEAGVKSLIREYRALVEDGAAHREQDDNAEDDHHEDHPGA